jgi:hypothetical protein
MPPTGAVEPRSMRHGACMLSALTPSSTRLIYLKTIFMKTKGTEGEKSHPPQTQPPALRATPILMHGMCFVVILPASCRKWRAGADLK